MLETSVVVLILVLAVAFLITSPKYYTLVILIGLLGLALMKCSNSEEFTDLSNAGGVDGDDTDMARGVLTKDFGNTDIESQNKSSASWDNSDAVNRLFAREPESTDGDQKLFDKMKSVAQVPKEAVLNRARFTSDNFRPLLQEELDEHSQRCGWWEDSNLECKMVKDGVDYFLD